MSFLVNVVHGSRTTRRADVDVARHVGFQNSKGFHPVGFQTPLNGDLVGEGVSGIF